MPDRPDNELPERERTPPEQRRDWETLQENDTEKTQRLMLWHGWLYRTITNGGDVAMVFVPEPRGDE